MDVEMVERVATEASSSSDSSSSDSSAALLYAVAAGGLAALARESTATARTSHHTNESDEAERLLLAPFLPLLTRLDHARSASASANNVHASVESEPQQQHAVASLLVRYEQASERPARLRASV